MKAARITALLVPAILTVGAARADAPSDIEVSNCIRMIQTRYAELERQDFHAAKRRYRSIIEELAQGLDLVALTPYQTSLLGPFLDDSSLSPDLLGAFVASLERAADDERYGAAALLMLNRIHWNDAERPYLRRFFDHPAMAATMNGWYGGMALNSFALEPPLLRENLRSIEQAVLAIHPDSLTEAPSRAAVARLLEALDHPEFEGDTRPARQRIHAHLLRVARSISAKFAPAGGASYAPEEYQIDRARDLLEFLEGPVSQSRLLGRPAPPLDFEWVRGPDAPFETLADLRGRVVVLDFWATWCGPCVAGFPKIRSLQEHYAGAPVVIIGITSIQGVHVPGDGGAIRLRGDPERERDLMEEFINEKNVTWNIAYSGRNVIDPRYDVWGIPHLTVIDAGGQVRHNGLNPNSLTIEDVRALIDPLLGADAP